MTEFHLNKTWDGQVPSDQASVTIKLEHAIDTNSLLVKVDAPFYDDPQLPAGIATVPGRVDGLWEYEVVETFFLGENENYLEIELDPRGHYLVLYLEGVRNVVKPNLTLDTYRTRIYDQKDGTGTRWNGQVLIPWDYLPPTVNKWNAYAIHKSGADRTYMSLYPVPQGEFPQPDFHRLEYFQPIDLNQSYLNK